MHEAVTIQLNRNIPDRKNITDVIQEYGKRLMGFIRARVAIEADAEDILQDVFYQLAGNTKPIEQMSAWLFRVTRNKIIDRQRKQKVDLVDNGADDDDFSKWAGILLDKTHHPEKKQLVSLFWNVLKTALDELPEEQREVFVLNEIEGVPFREIAEETGIAINTLISRKRYAVLHLRSRLEWLKADIMQM
jgi:RNA polymerase sigma factor (sigma-70 family)